MHFQKKRRPNGFHTVSAVSRLTLTLNETVRSCVQSSRSPEMIFKNWKVCKWPGAMGWTPPPYTASKCQTGVVALSRKEKKESTIDYFQGRQAINDLKLEYDVGEYYEYSHYQQILETACCEVSLLPPEYSPDIEELRLTQNELSGDDRKSTLDGIGRRLHTLTIPGYHVGRTLYHIAMAVRAYIRFKRENRLRLSEDLKSLISREFFNYLSILMKNIVPAVLNKKKRRKFERKYLMASWLILAKKR